MGRILLWLIISILTTNCSTTDKDLSNNLSTADTTAIIQECFNSQELKTLFKSYKDSTLKIFMNGFTPQPYSTMWDDKPVIYVSPYRYKYCFNDEFILQVTEMKVEKTKARISFWLQRQGSGADFEFSKIKDRWVIDTADTFLH
jgi:hypothetical protein